MTKALKLMCVLAHPDDETLGTGGILAKYANEGVHTHLVTATRGEYGWFGAEADNPGIQKLGEIREAELHEAATCLGLQDVTFMNYLDGHLDQAIPDEAIGKIVHEIRRVRPQVIVTFDPFGAYGHPDHIAISQFTTSAIALASDSTYNDIGNQKPHRVSKLYYVVDTKAKLSIYEDAFGELVMTIDDVERRAVGWEHWSITTRIDTSAYSKQIWDAVFCHRSQLTGYEALKHLPQEQQMTLFGCQSLYRAMSTVNGGREIEDDLFAGLR